MGLLLGMASPAAAELVAARIGDPPPPGWSLGGPDRDAGLGDFALGNGTVCAAISDPSHEGMLFATGGVLVDVGTCGRDDDQWTTLEMMWNFSTGTTLIVTEVEPGREGDRVWIRTRGERDGVRVETRYELDRAEPSALRIHFRFERVEEGPRFFSASLITLHPGGQTRPFTLFRSAPEKSVGFSYPESDPYSTLSRLRAFVPADLHVFVGAEEPPGIAYGLERVRAERVRADGSRAETLPMMNTTTGDATLTGFFVEPFWIGGGDPPGLLELAQTVFMDLDLGDRVEIDYRLWVTGRADVASVTDRLWADGALVQGTVDDRMAQIHVEDADGHPRTIVQPDERGRFELRLPPGAYRLRARSVARPDVVRDLSVGAADVALEPIVVGPPARTVLPEGRRMRLVFEGVEGTPDPRFAQSLLDFQVGGVPITSSWESRSVSLANVPGDPREVVLEPGRYRVTATRGPEFGLEQTDIVTEAGESVLLDLPEPTRVLETPGWISADLHVHSGRSFDSSWPLDRQVRSFAAEAAEVLVSTEHDRVGDPRPVIADLGLGDAIAGVPGVEITSVAVTETAPHTIGHMNAFPVERTASYRGGAPDGEGRRLREVLGDVRAIGAFSQLNHPRTSGRAVKGAYFTHLAVPGQPFDPSRPLSAEPNRILIEPDPKTGLRDLDFEALEGMNGEDVGSYRLVREDWFALLRQGERRTLTANSDSHAASATVALPRTYVRVGDDAPGSLDRAEFFRALREGRAFGTTGPMPDVRLGEAEIGDTFAGSSGELSVSVQAAPWVDVDEVRVYVDGVLVATRPIEAGRRLTVPLQFSGDAFVTVEVEGEPGAAYASVAPGFKPFAFTNPIFVDADGDGAWSPPGL